MAGLFEIPSSHLSVVLNYNNQTFELAKLNAFYRCLSYQKKHCTIDVIYMVCLRLMGCIYCGHSLTSLGKNCIGLDRISSDSGYCLNNVLPCCPGCNVRRRWISFGTMWRCMYNFTRYCSSHGLVASTIGLHQIQRAVHDMSKVVPYVSQEWRYCGFDRSTTVRLPANFSRHHVSLHGYVLPSAIHRMGLTEEYNRLNPDAPLLAPTTPSGISKRWLQAESPHACEQVYYTQLLGTPIVDKLFHVGGATA
ncbi:hypothetical protein AKO1_006238 [Acrasis kona]|uniref:Uncharacterized protein n=1 Tax=Acrasis kona TaxID=1008807 RepID=A0AAW2YKQ5_9EUKA